LVIHTYTDIPWKLESGALASRFATPAKNPAGAMIPASTNRRIRYVICSGGARVFAARGPGQTSVLPPPLIRSAIDILMGTTMALVWTVNSMLIRQKSGRISEFPSKCRPLHSAARGACPPSPPFLRHCLA